MVEEYLQRLKALAGNLDRDADPVEVRSELDSLAALNTLDMPEWELSPPAFLRTDDTGEAS